MKMRSASEGVLGCSGLQAPSSWRLCSLGGSAAGAWQFRAVLSSGSRKSMRGADGGCRAPLAAACETRSAAAAAPPAGFPRLTPRRQQTAGAATKCSMALRLRPVRLGSGFACTVSAWAADAFCGSPCTRVNCIVKGSHIVSTEKVGVLMQGLKGEAALLMLFPLMLDCQVEQYTLEQFRSGRRMM